MLVVYSINDCKWCEIIKKMLTENGIDYEEKNVMESRENKVELAERVNYSKEVKFPVVCKDSECVMGANIPKIKGLF